ncbi:alanine racemase [Teredinibacter turnerae]|uniref:alanine racemase n=1 Tax=Teredinibacter turnerae TaxID=2426 RepID=UPI00037A48FF|nr:alanine racemase [Teredinibacter turnerae]
MTHTLTINLSKIAANWQALNRFVSASVDCGAVVKADAYSLGMAEVLPALYLAGCRTFYVANLGEALDARGILSDLCGSYSDVAIVVLGGCAPGEERRFIDCRLVPVLVSTAMLERWCAVNGGEHNVLGSILKLNTGMGRLGLEPAEFDRIVQEPAYLARADVRMLMSHLACADEPEHSLNVEQLHRFRRALEISSQRYRPLTASLANSAGVCLGGDYHFNAVRPGLGLYTSFAQAEACGLGLETAVELHLPVVQVRKLPAGESVGYGATYRAEREARLAVVAGGYADGLFRALSNRAHCWVSAPGGAGGWRVPVVGRISMDTTIVDISAVPEGVVEEGSRIEFIGAHVPLDDLAASAQTINYEILTSLGVRYKRHYIRANPS